ncbi:MAG: twin-arginine translocase subunit TatC [Candidatus Margulisiibacteriota bacterium]
MAQELTLIDHIRELRKRLILSVVAVLVCSVVAFLLYDTIIAMLMRPFRTLPGAMDQYRLYITSIFEGFVTEIKLSLIFGCIISIPVHVYNAIRFLFPALSSKERKLFGYSLFASLLLGLFGFYLVYFKLIPYSLKFVTSASFIPNHVGLLLNFTQNIFYILDLLLGAIVLFQFPIVLEILLYLNIVTRKALLKSGRYVIVLIFVVAGIITPTPDAVAQLGLAVPMIALYYLTILIAKIFGFGEST